MDRLDFITGPHIDRSCSEQGRGTSWVRIARDIPEDGGLSSVNLICDNGMIHTSFKHDVT